MNINMEDKINVFDFGDRLATCQGTKIGKVERSIVLKECTLYSDHFEGYPLFKNDEPDFLNTYSKVVDLSDARFSALLLRYEFVSAQINRDGTTTIFAHSSTPFE